MAKRKRREEAPAELDESSISYQLNDIPDGDLSNKRRKEHVWKRKGLQSVTKRRSNRLSTSTAPTPTLLGIPGELRNQIYRYALLEDYEIGIDSSNYMQPGILRVSRQIRSEASKIYYEENRFCINIHDLKFEPQAFHWAWNHVDRCPMEFHGTSSWRNLKAWLKLFWKDQDTPCTGEPNPDADESLFVWEQAFNIVETLTDTEPKTPWKVVNDVLEAFKKGTDAKTGDFAWDE